MNENSTEEEIIDVLAWKFWSHIVLNEDGSLNKEAVKKELRDFYVMLKEVPKVYCHITGGKLSKPLCPSDIVIGEADAYYDKLCKEYQNE